MVSDLSCNHYTNNIKHNPTLIYSSEIWLSYIIPVLESVVSGRFCNPNHRLGFKHESILHVMCEQETRKVIGASQYLNIALPST